MNEIPLLRGIDENNSLSVGLAVGNPGKMIQHIQQQHHIDGNLFRGRILIIFCVFISERETSVDIAYNVGPTYTLVYEFTNNLAKNQNINKNAQPNASVVYCSHFISIYLSISQGFIIE